MQKETETATENYISSVRVVCRHSTEGDASERRTRSGTTAVTQHHRLLIRSRRTLGHLFGGLDDPAPSGSGGMDPSGDGWADTPVIIPPPLLAPPEFDAEHQWVVLQAIPRVP